MTVKAIIFDLGGVLLRTADFAPREKLANRLGMSRAELEEFFAMDEIDTNLLGFIRHLDKTYQTGLLSNAFDDLRQIISERWHCGDAFDDMVFSAEVGLVKNRSTHQSSGSGAPRSKG